MPTDEERREEERERRREEEREREREEERRQAALDQAREFAEAERKAAERAEAYRARMRAARRDERRRAARAEAARAERQDAVRDALREALRGAAREDAARAERREQARAARREEALAEQRDAEREEAVRLERREQAAAERRDEERQEQARAERRDEARAEQREADRADAARAARRDAARADQQEAERRDLAQAERRAQAQAEQREADRRAQAQADRRVQAQAEQREADRRAQAQADRRVQAQAERQDADRRAQAQADRRAQAQIEQRDADRVEQARSRRRDEAREALREATRREAARTEARARAAPRDDAPAQRLPSGRFSGALPWLRADGPRLLDELDRPVTLRGAAVVASESSADGIGDGDLAALADWGANALLLPIAQQLVLVDESYRAELDTAIESAAGAGMYTILSLAHIARPRDELGEAPIPDAASPDVWRMLGLRYALEPAVLFDLFRSPGDPGAEHPLSLAIAQLEWPVWRRWLLAFLGELRRVHPRALVLAHGLDRGRDLTGFPLVFTDGTRPTNIVYAGDLRAGEEDAVLAQLERLAAVAPVFAAVWEPDPAAVARSLRVGRRLAAAGIHWVASTPAAGAAAVRP